MLFYNNQYSIKKYFIIIISKSNFYWILFVKNYFILSLLLRPWKKIIRLIYIKFNSTFIPIGIESLTICIIISFFSNAYSIINIIIQVELYFCFVITFKFFTFIYLVSPLALTLKSSMCLSLSLINLTVIQNHLCYGHHFYNNLYKLHQVEPLISVQ
jgi:hypothetical protein